MGTIVEGVARGVLCGECGGPHWRPLSIRVAAGRINGCVPFTLYWSDDEVERVALPVSCFFMHPHGGEWI